MSEAWRVASITHFEQLPVGTGALLRVAATSTIAARPDDERPTLVADDGYGISHFTALPAPPDDTGELRCAFSVPVEITAGGTVFSLELPDGNVIALAAPTGTAPLPTWEEPARGYGEGAEYDPYAEYDADDGSLMLGLLLDAAEARAELRALYDLQALAPGSTPRAHVAPAGPASQDAGAQLAELQVWSDELERRLAAATTALDEAYGEVDRLRAELDGSAEPSSDQLSEIAGAALDEAQLRAERDLSDVTSR